MRGQVTNYIMNALENGKIVGYQGRGTGRAIYEFPYNGELHNAVVTVGNNEFVVGANPKYKRMRMKVIKIKFEYGCFPVWIYGENDELIENDLPPYLIGDNDIDSKFVRIQEIFFSDLFLAIHLLKNKLNDEYIIEDSTDFLRNSIY